MCGACYEVPEEMRDEVAAVVPAAWATTRWGTPALDLGAGVRAQLDRAGVATVHDVGGCTREDDALPSYRRDGAAASRFAGRGLDADAMSRRRRDRRRPGQGPATGSPRACAEAGRDPDEVTLVVVTKFFPASDVRLLADLGVTDVGENRHQEAEAKAAECADLGLTLALHRRAAEQQGRRRGVVRRRRRVGRPGQAGAPACSAAPTSAAATVDVLLQVSLDPPDADGPVRRRPRRPATSSPPRSRRPGCSGCAA